MLVSLSKSEDFHLQKVRTPPWATPALGRLQVQEEMDHPFGLALPTVIPWARATKLAEV